MKTDKRYKQLITVIHYRDHKRTKTCNHTRQNILIQPVCTGVHPQRASQTKSNSHFLRNSASPWCSCLSAPFFINSTEYLERSTPKSSCCCFRISSMSLELFLLNTPVKQDVSHPSDTIAPERDVLHPLKLDTTIKPAYTLASVISLTSI